MRGGSVLIITQPPHDGGVPAKTRYLCRHLRARGRKVTVGWYATFGHDGDLNAPSWRIAAGARPAIRQQYCFGDFPGVAIGSWLPELEAPYYLPSSRWRQLIASHDRHVAVGGPPLVGHLLAATGTPGLLWCASDLEADRHDRVAAMPASRRLVHDALTLPWIKSQQARTLARLPRIMGVSRYTVERLAAQGCARDRLSLLHIPVETADFQPLATPSAGAVVGFAGRFEDPRKNLDLALRALACLRRGGMAAKLRLAGAVPSPATLARVDALGLTGAVDFAGELALADLPRFYQGLDVFVLPSHQEGLCIAGLEALACGVPVVSTRCGGPEDYVRDGETGFLAEADPESMAWMLARIIGDRVLRQHLSRGARRIAEAEFSPAAFAGSLSAAWRAVWGEEV